MAFDLDPDLLAILDTEDFAVTATFGGSSSASVIFENAYAAQLGYAGTQPRATGRLSDFSSLAVGAAITISGKAYQVAEKQEDPLAGLVVLILESAT